MTLLKKSCDDTVALGCLGLGELYATGKMVTRNDSIARSLFDKACDGNEMEGCYRLALAYENGEGGAPRFDQASWRYREACENRHGPSCARLAGLYQRGAGVYRDAQAEKEFRKRACDYGVKSECPTPKGAA